MKSEGVLLALRQAVAITGGQRDQNARPVAAPSPSFPFFDL